MTQFIPSHEITFLFMCVFFPDSQARRTFSLPLLSLLLFYLASCIMAEPSEQQQWPSCIPAEGSQGYGDPGPVLLALVLLGPFLTPVC